MEHRDVRSWVARSFPYVIVDEAQDLKPERLRIVRALEIEVAMFVAADEFQCLATDLRSNPAIEWIAERTEPTVLDLPRRTRIPDLLAAAHAVRVGESVQVDMPNFKVIAAPGRPPFVYAATCLANAIAWNRGNDIAVITPSKTGGFASGVVERVVAGPVGTRQNGPYPIIWEALDSEELTALLGDVSLPDDGDFENLLAALNAASSHPAIRLCRDWVRRQRSIGARAIFPPNLVKEQLAACVTQHRRRAQSARSRFRAMTVHQAKNREFDGVIVLWPYSVAGDAEQQRRLLYNAITRAKC